MTSLVYLCGPITGSNETDATTWRQKVHQSLPSTIVCIDPTREIPDYVRQAETKNGKGRLERLVHGQATLTRDRMDVQRCDIVLANFLGAKQVSIGSVGEIFWADSYRKPVIIVREENGNPHDHDMLNSIACSIYHSLEPAIEKIITLLSTNSFNSSIN